MKSNTIQINGETLDYIDSKEGNTTLLFIHGAFINKEYWSEQLSYFSTRYRVIAIDQAGHGNSSHHRTDWTIQNYGKDLSEFIRRLSLEKVILIGHSFGSDVILEAVTIDASAIKGLIEIDHMKNVGVKLPQETINHLVESLNTDFQNTCEQYARQALITEKTEPELVAKLLKDYCEMSPEVGISLLQNSFDYPIRGAELLKTLKLKLHLLHVDYLPTNEENLEKYLGNNYELHPIRGTSHYPMVENSKAFNAELEKVLSRIEEN